MMTYFINREIEANSAYLLRHFVIDDMHITKIISKEL